MHKYKKLSKIILIELIISIFFVICMIINIKIQNKQYEKILNEKVANIATVVKEKYPNIDERELIEVIKNNNNVDNTLLEKYGYTTDLSYMNEIKNIQNKNTIIDTIIIIFFGVLQVIIFEIYQNKKNIEINQINSYLKELNKKNYKLEIEENDEDDLSKLRNELYKTTILLKEVAENSEKEKTQLSNSLADISHQLKTPLTSIRIMLDNIYENPEMNEKIRQEFIQDISRQVDWITSLVISLLKLARFDAGAIIMNDSEFKIKKLIDDVILNLSILLDIKNIKIIENVDENIISKLDYNWQKEALTNILKNAIEHSDNGSNIFIEAENSSLFLKIRIKDEGDGISKEDKKHIFERFYKANKSSENSIGIGLALSKTIIEKESGTIKVISELGKGTTFEIEYMR